MTVVVKRDIVPCSIVLPEVAQQTVVRRATFVYRTGSCMVIQADGWSQFLVVAKVGMQYTEEELGEMIDKLKELEITDDTVTFREYEKEPVETPPDTHDSGGLIISG